MWELDKRLEVDIQYVMINYYYFFSVFIGTLVKVLIYLQTFLGKSVSVLHVSQNCKHLFYNCLSKFTGLHRIFCIHFALLTSRHMQTLQMDTNYEPWKNEEANKTNKWMHEWMKMQMKLVHLIPMHFLRSKSSDHTPFGEKLNKLVEKLWIW